MKKQILTALLCTLTFFAASTIVNAASQFLYVSSEGEIIFNGESLGQGTNLISDGSDYAYETMKSDGVHVIFNGVDVGLGQYPIITEGKLLYQSEYNFKNRIVFNRQSLDKAPEGYNPIVKDGHYVFFKKVNDERLRDVLQGSTLAFYDGKYYCDSKDETVEEKIKFAGDNVICEQEISSDGETKQFVIFNGKIVAEGYNVKVSEKHYAYTKEKSFGTDDVEILILNGVEDSSGKLISGTELGEGVDFEFSDNNFIYYRDNIYGNEELIFNGKSLGEFKDRDSVFFTDGHVAFLRDKKEQARNTDGSYSEVTKTHLFYDGVDQGVIDVQSIDNKGIFMAEDIIAFERTVKGIIDYDSNGNAQEGDITYLVYNGKVKTEIESGSLKMDDTGTLAFIKKLEVYDAATDTYTEKDYIYKMSSDGKMTQLGQGEAETVYVSEGRVAYVKKDEADDTYVSQGQTLTRTIQADYIMIDGNEKGIGDITTLVLSKDQYAFAQNKKGRLYLTINGKQQVYPGSKVVFLENESVATKTTIKTSASTTNVKKVLRGYLYKKGSRFYLKLGQKYVRVIPSKAQSVLLEKYEGEKIYVKVKKTLYRYKKSGRRFYAYKLYSYSTKKISISDEDAGIKSYTGVLEKDNNGYKLKRGSTSYYLRIQNPLKVSDFESYVGDIVELKMEKDGSTWKVYSLPQ